MNQNYDEQQAIESAIQNDPGLLAHIQRDDEVQKSGSSAVRAGEPGDATEDDTGAHSGLGAFPKAAWRGLFAEYRDEMRRCSEAADAYNFLTLWAAAGNALGRRVWFPYGMKLYANVYGIAFGPSGDFKTSACRRGAEITEGSVGRVVQGIGSGEGITSGLGEQPTLFFLEEFTSLLRQGKWEGSTLLPTLTEIFDCPERYQREYRKNPISLERPVCSILGCTTEAWFWGAVRDSDFEGGFANRFIYLTGSANEPMSLPGIPNLMAITSRISRLRALPEQEVLLELRAQQLWGKFYDAWRKAIRPPLEGAAVKRVPAYVLKLAMTYAALEGTLPEISAAQLSAAMVVGGYAARCVRQLVAVRFSGTNAHRELEQRIIAAVGHSVTRRHCSVCPEAGVRWMPWPEALRRLLLGGGDWRAGAVSPPTQSGNEMAAMRQFVQIGVFAVLFLLVRSRQDRWHERESPSESKALAELDSVPRGAVPDTENLPSSGSLGALQLL